MRETVSVNENKVLQTIIKLSNCSKMALNQKNANDVTICWNDVIIIFYVAVFLLWSLLTGSKSHVNVINGSGVMTIFVYKELIRNAEIGNTPVWLLFNMWRLGCVRDTDLSTNVSNERLLNAEKDQGYSLYHFVKWKRTGVVKITLPPRLRLINPSSSFNKTNPSPGK